MGQHIQFIALKGTHMGDCSWVEEVIKGETENILRMLSWCRYDNYVPQTYSKETVKEQSTSGLNSTFYKDHLVSHNSNLV